MVTLPLRVFAAKWTGREVHGEPTRHNQCLDCGGKLTELRCLHCPCLRFPELFGNRLQGVGFLQLPDAVGDRYRIGFVSNKILSQLCFDQFGVS